MVLLDTCALLWWTLDPDKLSEEGARVLADKDKRGLLLSSISIWEIGIKMKKGKLNIPISFDEYLARVRKIAGLTIIPVDENIWAENLRLDWEHPDPADRTIVATAALRGVPIVTRDERIAGFYSNIIW